MEWEKEGQESAAVQVRDEKQGGSSRNPENCSGSRYIPNGKPLGFANGFSLRSENKRGVEVWGLEPWKDCVAIN